MDIRINAPLSRDAIPNLKAGDHCLITGTIYTARDAAHKRLFELIESGNPLPINLEDAIIYYVGPTPSKPEQVIGSAGPTTAYRMDAYAPKLIEQGVTAMIGKGKRGTDVIESMKKYGAVYFAAIGGCGALLSKCVESSEIVCYEDLGAEAIRKLYVRDFPVIVAIDSEGNNLYELGKIGYLNSLTGK